MGRVNKTKEKGRSKAQKLLLQKMEKATESLSVGKEVSVGKAYCKCGEGWQCEIKRTQGPDAGKTFVKCGHNCTCILEVTENGEVKVEELVNEMSDGAFCECGEGWSCTVSKIEQPEITKSFAECVGNCSCITSA